MENNRNFRLNLNPNELSLKKAMENTLGPVYQEDINKAFYQDDKNLLHKLMGLTKAHLYAK